MKTKLLISVASAALIGVSSLAFAQSPGGAPAQSGTGNAPAASIGDSSHNAPAAALAPAGRAEGAPGKAAQGAREGAPRDGMAQRAQDGNSADVKSKATVSESDRKAGKANETAAPNRAASDDGMKANPKNAASDAKPDAKAGTTTGQAAAGGKQITSEQRTTIRTSITKLNVRPVTNVNFSISVGTRVPRGVAFHPLPSDVISFYPDWRGYEFILVGDQIVVVNPRTLEIVAVLDA